MANHNNNNDIIKNLKKLTESDINEIIKNLESASGVKASGNSANTFKEKIGNISNAEINNLMKKANSQDMSQVLDKFKLSKERKNGK